MAEDPVEPEGGEQDSSVIKKLRKQLADLTTERDGLKADKRQRAFVDAGVVEAGRKAMDRLYEGDLDADQIRAFAEENGIATVDDEASTTTDPPPAGVVSDDEQQRRAAQQRVNGVTAIGTNPPPATPDTELNTKITEAEQAGDVRQSLALKAQKLERLRAST